MRAKNILAAVAAAVGLAASAAPALAHPHVWVTASATVLYDHNTITGLQQAWTFDEFYTQQAIEGLDKNGDGKYGTGRSFRSSRRSTWMASRSSTISPSPSSAMAI